MPERRRKQKSDNQREQQVQRSWRCTMVKKAHPQRDCGPWRSHGRTGTSLERAAAHAQAQSQRFPDWNAACQRPTLENRKEWEKESNREKLLHMNPDLCCMLAYWKTGGNLQQWQEGKSVWSEAWEWWRRGARSADESGREVELGKGENRCFKCLSFFVSQYLNQ